MVALQEVRAKNPGEGQLNDLQSILPQYKYSAFAIASDVHYPEGSYIFDEEHEGDKACHKFDNMTCSYTISLCMFISVYV